MTLTVRRVSDVTSSLRQDCLNAGHFNGMAWPPSCIEPSIDTLFGCVGQVISEKSLVIVEDPWFKEGQLQVANGALEIGSILAGPVRWRPYSRRMISAKGPYQPSRWRNSLLARSFKRLPLYSCHFIHFRCCRIGISLLAIWFFPKMFCR